MNLNGEWGGITKNEPVINGDKMKWERSNKIVPRKQNSERLIHIRPEIWILKEMKFPSELNSERLILC